MLTKRARYAIVGMAALLAGGRAQPPEPSLPRPGSVLVTSVLGEATAGAGDQNRALKGDERVRIGSVIATGRRSLVTLSLSNGATLQLGAESELEIEEFGQATVPSSVKLAELKEEPTISRTRLRLMRGDVIVEVKPLKLSRGSSFVLSTVAGDVRSGEGTFRARVQMSELGLGVCTLELQKGAAEFELAGATTFAPMPLGRKLAFAIELDKATGAAKVGEMPKPTAKAKE